MFKDMKSVVMIYADEPDEVTARKMEQFRADNPGFSAVGDKHVPNAKATQEYLRRYA
ncbi:hypothetical protein [Gracilibacillus dipsosauri]|uniref:hypothetical protein n=1 Tax=Gracilibacillus dipsosauri TaxID=178340 RepID=UPI0015E86562|nr:hypothetical protein [Gracilibacillus dipsosauri]